MTAADRRDDLAARRRDLARIEADRAWFARSCRDGV